MSLTNPEHYLDKIGHDNSFAQLVHIRGGVRAKWTHVDWEPFKGQFSCEWWRSYYVV